MFSLGFGEIVLLAFIALVFIGPEQLPEVAKAVARLINEWKRASSDLTGTITKNIREDVVNRIEETRESFAQNEPVPAIHQEHQDHHDHHLHDHLHPQDHALPSEQLELNLTQSSSETSPESLPENPTKKPKDES